MTGSSLGYITTLIIACTALLTLAVYQLAVIADRLKSIKGALLLQAYLSIKDTSVEIAESGNEERL